MLLSRRNVGIVHRDEDTDPIIVTDYENKPFSKSRVLTGDFFSALKAQGIMLFIFSLLKAIGYMHQAHTDAKLSALIKQ